MNAMLFKHDSPTAREAMWQLAGQAKALPAAAPLEPSAEAREIARLEAKVAALNAELAEMRSEWATQLGDARAAAKAEAARDHVAQDEKRIAALDSALANTRSEFESTLESRIEPLAAQLAARAFAQLATLREGDDDWLAQVIARRVEGIAADSVVTLHIAPDEEEDTLDLALKQNGVHLETIQRDPTLKPGTARLVLRLGAIDLRPDEGAKEILRLLEQAGGELG